MTETHVRHGPFLRTGFSILSRKAFGWVGGLVVTSARKNYEQGKNLLVVGVMKGFVDGWVGSVNSFP